ncbi:MAG TPA: chemotaxis protein CheX [Verrucomicrobiae bacterium]|nr:chemotaxis protein CheX [Verrucomicrobiae bacterium]
MNASSSPFDSDRERWMPTLQLAAQEVFELMLASPLTVPVQPPAEESLDITSMVGLAGELCGVMSVRCSTRAAARMASQMLGTDPAAAGAEMWDALGEICNMIAGNFKNKITGLGDGCVLSVPTVITGADYNLHSLVNEEIRIVLLFQDDPVVILLEVHN